jgi:hypothetical protein
LATDGDYLEKRCWPLFLRNEFPTYERFWYLFVAPLTNRDKDRSDVRFKATNDLKAAGFDEFDLYLAQLNYSVLWHLYAVSRIRASGDASGWDAQLFVNAIIRLCSALDSADELLQLDSDGRPLPKDPWASGQRKRAEWRRSNRALYFQELQKYRNQLAHSGPFMYWPQGPLFPSVGRHETYRDWRRATSPLRRRELAHFKPASDIVADGWRRSLRYLETSWKHLLRGRGRSRMVLPAIATADWSEEVQPVSFGGYSGAPVFSTGEPIAEIGRIPWSPVAPDAHSAAFVSSFAEAADLRILDALVGESEPVTSTTTPHFRRPRDSFWSSPVSGSASSATPPSSILSGTMPPPSAITPPQPRVRRRQPRRSRSASDQKP